MIFYEEAPVPSGFRGCPLKFPLVLKKESFFRPYLKETKIWRLSESP